MLCPQSYSMTFSVCSDTGSVTIPNNFFEHKIFQFCPHRLSWTNDIYWHTFLRLAQKTGTHFHKFLCFKLTNFSITVFGSVTSRFSRQPPPSSWLLCSINCRTSRFCGSVLIREFCSFRKKRSRNIPELENMFHERFPRFIPPWLNSFSYDSLICKRLWKNPR